MCKSFDLCDGGDSGAMCELYAKSNKKGLSCADYTNDYPEEAVEIVERWAKAHPRKTRQSEFLKQFPKARLFDDVLAIDTCKIDSSRFNTEECHMYDEFGTSGCDECRRQFWNEEIE